MEIGAGRLVDLIRESYREWKEMRPSLLAGGLSYFALFSATPLLVILINILGPLVAKRQVMAQLDDVFGSRMGHLFRNWMIPVRSSGSPTFTTVSAILLLYGASLVFIQLKRSLDFIWQVPVRNQTAWRGFVRFTLIPLGMILASGVFICVSIVLETWLGMASHLFGSVLAHSGGGWIWKVTSFFPSVALLTLLFGGILKWVPDAPIRWGDVWPGAILTSILFALGKIGLAFYFSHHSSLDTIYGAAGSFLAIMIWVYVSAHLFFFGAIFTKVYSFMRRDAS